MEPRTCWSHRNGSPPRCVCLVTTPCKQYNRTITKDLLIEKFGFASSSFSTSGYSSFRWSPRFLEAITSETICTYKCPKPIKMKPNLICPWQKIDMQKFNSKPGSSHCFEISLQLAHNIIAPCFRGSPRVRHCPNNKSSPYLSLDHTKTPWGSKARRFVLQFVNSEETHWNWKTQNEEIGSFDSEWKECLSHRHIFWTTLIRSELLTVKRHF